MGLFERNKIEIKKESKKDGVDFIVDCFKAKDTIEFERNLVKDLVGENFGYMVIETKLTYGDSNQDNENAARELIDFLENNNISYAKKTKSVDAPMTILGETFKLGKDAKVKNHILGFRVTAETFEKLLFVFARFNLFCYVLTEETQLLSIIERYDQTSAEQNKIDDNDEFEYNTTETNTTETNTTETDKAETIKTETIKIETNKTDIDKFVFHIYADKSFKRVCIASDLKRERYIEEILKKYSK
jgi:hypothetical protein